MKAFHGSSSPQPMAVRIVAALSQVASGGKLRCLGDAGTSAADITILSLSEPSLESLSYPIRELLLVWPHNLKKAEGPERCPIMVGMAGDGEGFTVSDGFLVFNGVVACPPGTTGRRASKSI